MNDARYSGRLAVLALAAVLAGTAPAVFAEQAETSPRSTYGMMGGYGMGPGMMGGHGMGPGMMGGYGMGPGMMGGYGMGHGMMGAFWGSRLELSDEQQARLNKIQDDTRKEHWALMGAMLDQQARLRDLYQAPKQDNAAIDAAYQAIGKLQQQMYDSSESARKRMEAILTQEQKEKLRSFWRRGWAP